MRRTLGALLILALAAACSPEPAPEEPESTTAADTAETAGGGYVDDVTRAQGKAKAITEAENQRVEDVNREIDQE